MCALNAQNRFINVFVVCRCSRAQYGALLWTNERTRTANIGIYWIWAWTWCEARPYIYRSVLLICFSNRFGSPSTGRALRVCDVLHALCTQQWNNVKREIYTNFKVNAWFAHVNEFSIEPFRSHWRMSDVQWMRPQREPFSKTTTIDHTNTDPKRPMRCWFGCWSIFSRFPRRRLLFASSIIQFFFIKIRPSPLPLLILIFLIRFFSFHCGRCGDTKLTKEINGSAVNRFAVKRMTVYIVGFYDFIYAEWFRFVEQLNNMSSCRILLVTMGSISDTQTQLLRNLQCNLATHVQFENILHLCMWRHMTVSIVFIYEIRQHCISICFVWARE